MSRIWNGSAYIEEPEAHAAQRAADAEAFANPPAVDLIAYAQRKQAVLASGGYSFNVGTAEAPSVAHADTDIDGRVNLSGLVQLAALKADFTSVWVQAEGSLSLDAAQIVSLGIGVGHFIEETFKALAGIIAAIGAGDIRTFAAIDTFAWPASSG